MAALTRRWPPSQSATSSALAMASPPEALDLVDHLLGRRAVVARAVDGPAEVVHDHLGALLGEQQRVLAADAAARPGDDGDAPVERSHGLPLLTTTAEASAPARTGNHRPNFVAAGSRTALREAPATAP